MRETTALVTGAHGFLGRHVARGLAAAGWRVFGLGHGQWDEPAWRAWGLSSWTPGDVTRATLERLGADPALIVHCAGGGSVGHSFARPGDDFHRTVTTTVEVLEYIHECQPDCVLVYPSSAAVYGRVERLPITEQTPGNLVSPYGLHKRMAEDAVICHAHNFAIRAAIVRFFSLYGPELRKQLFWDACERLRKGERRFFGSGEEIRDWLHVGDAVELLRLAADHASTECPVVNGGFGEGIRVREALRLLCEAHAMDGQPEFGGTPKRGDPDHYVADIQRARAWGWQPRIPLRQGLAEYVDWYRARDVS